MKKALLLLLGSLALSSIAGAQKLWHVRVETNNARSIAQALEDEGFDVLHGQTRRGSLELIVSDEEMMGLMRYGFYPEVIRGSRPLYEAQAEGPDAPPAGYKDLAMVYAEMQAAAASFPAICEFVDLTARYGTPSTFEGRSLYAIKISDNVGTDEDEPAVLVVGAHHCRELITPEIALKAIEELTTGYGSDPTVTSMVDGNEIWIAPVWNPDGYEYVFTTNDFWRKNRRVFAQGVGVDLNRNYDFGWSTPCGGSTNVNSDTYRGPSVGSEAETQTMEVWSEDVRFAKVLDFHSSGRETLWAYAACSSHPFSSYLQQQAINLSQAAGYGNSNRPPSANGEHYEWQLSNFGNHAFLMETGTQFQPPYANALAEAAQVYPSIETLIQLDIPLSGIVTDAISGLPVSASLSVTGVNYTNGETNTSDPNTGRYYAFVPRGSYTATFSAPGYRDACIGFTVNAAGTAQTRDVSMMPLAACPSASVTFRNGGGNPAVYSATTMVVGQPTTFTVDTQGFAFATIFAVLCPQDRLADVGQLLIDVDSAPLFILADIPGPTAQITTTVTNDPSMCGLTVYTQAKIHNAARRPFVVTNALDFVIGGN
jgi:hypothetical protein